MKCVLALDQGTTSSRAILFDRTGRIRASAQREFKQYFPQPGWVEHNPEEIWETQQQSAFQAMHQAGVHAEDIAAIGITNQRENHAFSGTGKPASPSTMPSYGRIEEPPTSAHNSKPTDSNRSIAKKQDCLLTLTFPAPRLSGCWDHVEGARSLARRGELAFGTIDSWLIWKLTRGALHITRRQ